MISGMVNISLYIFFNNFILKYCQMNKILNFDTNDYYSASSLILIIHSYQQFTTINT